MQGREVVRAIRRLPVEQAITDAYEATGPLGVAKPSSGWTNQKEHLIGWFSEISGPGAYNRQSRTWTAKEAYNHFQCAPGLLWLAEALGEDPATITKALEAVKAARRAASQCAALRRVIPWERVEELIYSSLGNAPRASTYSVTTAQLPSAPGAGVRRRSSWSRRSPSPPA